MKRKKKSSRRRGASRTKKRNKRKTFIRKKETQPRQKSSHNTSKFKGVTFISRSQKWLARARFKGKLHFIGYYDSEISAAKARDLRMIKENGGTFDGLGEDELNFPSSWLRHVILDEGIDVDTEPVRTPRTLPRELKRRAQKIKSDKKKKKRATKKVKKKKQRHSISTSSSDT